MGSPYKNKPHILTKHPGYYHSLSEKGTKLNVFITGACLVRIAHLEIHLKVYP